MQSLRNKNALVTGAAAGIGRAIALRLAREGVDLYLLDVNEPGLANIVSAVRRAGVSALGRYCDVSQPADITRSVTDALARWGKIDVLVNNAGITYYGDTSEMSAADADRLLAINLHAPIQFTRELLPTLLAQPEAHVLNVASLFGLIGTRKLSLYSASKFGLVGFSESLRTEYGRRGLGVTALCPGFVDTDLFDAAPRGSDLQDNKRPPKWMLTTPDKIADRAVKAICRNRSLDVVQSYAQMAHYCKRFFPGVLDWASHLSRKKMQSKITASGSKDTRRKAA
jgi:short-subunit dehydrogenase